MYRQFSKPVDLEYTLNKHTQALTERSEELFHAQEDVRELEANLSRDRSVLSESHIALYEREIEIARKKEKALQFRCFHLQDELQALSKYTGGKIDPETVECRVYDWTYDPFDFTYDMDQEEIYYRAIKELYSIGQTKIHALANCGVRARRCSTAELIDMCRWYSAPKSSERYKWSDIEDSSYFDDITGADPLAQAIKRAADEIDEQAKIAFYQSVQNTSEAVKDITGHPSVSEKSLLTSDKTNVTMEKKLEKSNRQIKKATVEKDSKTAVNTRRTIVRARDVHVSQAAGSADLIGED